MGYIYKILNITNEKFYIGSTNNLKRRFEQHKYMLRNNKHHSVHLQRAWNKYGENSFKWIILKDDVDVNDLLVIEQEYLDELQPFYPKGYNIKENTDVGGVGSGENHPRSTMTNEEVIEIKRLLSEGTSQKHIVEEMGYSWGTVGKIASLNRWTNVGSEYNDKLKSIKRIVWQEWMMDKLIDMKLKKYKNKEIADELGVRVGLISSKYSYYIAGKENRIKQCNICGSEIILKTKNSNQKFCKECAKKRKYQKDKERRELK